MVAGSIPINMEIVPIINTNTIRNIMINAYFKKAEKLIILLYL